MLLYHRPSKAFYNLTISQIPAPAQVFACAILAEHLNMEMRNGRLGSSLYLQYSAERTRPAAELLAQVPLADITSAVDLGCGRATAPRC